MGLVARQEMKGMAKFANKLYKKGVKWNLLAKT